MHPGIVVRSEASRGCGYRSVGRMYLVCDEPAKGCGKMPIPLEVCPCCGQGIEPSRAPQWLEQPERLWRDISCNAGNGSCSTCPLSAGYETGEALLIWVGKKYYKTGADFMRESRFMGVSRFIKHIPRKFVLGETWVLLAHRKACEIAPIFSEEPQWQPGIFSVFRPTRIEIIVDGTESDEVINGYIERGLTPVLIQKPDKKQSKARQGSLL